MDTSWNPGAAANWSVSLGMWLALSEFSLLIGRWDTHNLSPD